MDDGEGGQMSEKDGGPAFPLSDLSAYGIGPAISDEGTRYLMSGMSYRRWLAGQAISGLLAGSRIGTPKEFALDAWLYADAIIAEEDKSG